MPNKKLVVGAAVFLLVFGTYYLYQDFQNTVETDPKPQAFVSQNADLAAPQKWTSTQTSMRDENQPALMVPAPHESTEIADSDEFLTSAVFSSPDSIDNAFIQSDGAIVSESLTHLLQHDNFDEVVNRIREAGYNELSSNREALLSKHLNNTLGAEVFKSDYSCSGSICVLTFQSLSDVSEQQFTELAKFDKNYSFTNTVTNDLGETTVNAVYIATEDPSTLSLTR